MSPKPQDGSARRPAARKRPATTAPAATAAVSGAPATPVGASLDPGLEPLYQFAQRQFQQSLAQTGEMARRIEATQHAFEKAMRDARQQFDATGSRLAAQGGLPLGLPEILRMSFEGWFDYSEALYRGMLDTQAHLLRELVEQFGKQADAGETPPG
jgi:hypothetical protein